MKRLYVGNLVYEVDETQLAEMFEPYGKVEQAAIIRDRDTKRSKGFGFVTMDDAAADAAINALNGKEVSGRALTVNEARPQEQRSNGGGGDRGGDRGGYRR